ncbi:MAG: hypothetical protein QM762_12820 [Chryseolinea sp.]
MRTRLRGCGAIMLLSLIVFLSIDTLAQESDSIRRIPVWRARMIAEDLTSFDQLKFSYHVLWLDYQDLREINYSNNRSMYAQRMQMAEKDVQIKLLDQKVTTALLFQPLARKYKRQRNGVAVVGIVVVAGLTYVLIQSLKG